MPKALQTLLGAVLTAACAFAAVAQEAAPSLLVTDRAGKPVAGATLRAGETTALTGEDGRTARPAADWIEVVAPGFLPWFGEPAERVELLRPSRVEVRVVDERTRAPIGGAEIAIFVADEEVEEGARRARRPPADRAAAEPLLTRTSSRTGRVAFDGLHPRPLRIRITAAGRVDEWSLASPGVESTEELIVTSRRAARLVGRVRSGEQPVADAQVRVVRVVSPAERLGRGRRGPRARRGQDRGGYVRGVAFATDETGRFGTDQLPRRRAATLYLVALAPDGRWGLARVPASVSGSESEAEGAEKIEVHVDLSQNALATGQVLWSDGTPAEGVAVQAEIAEAWTGFGGRMERTLGVDLSEVFEDFGGGPLTVTGPEGVFVLPGLPRVEWRLTAAPADHVESEPVLVDLSSGQAEPVDLVVPVGRRVEGRVVDSRGNPVPSAEVLAELRGGGGGFLRGRGRGGRGGGASLTTSTGRDGKFELSGFGAGTLVLRVSADGFGRKQVELDVDEDRVRVVLTATGAVTGRVVSGATGEPLTRFTVSPFRAAETTTMRTRWRGQARGREVLTEDGSFRVDELEAGSWAVTVKAEGYLATTGEPLEVIAGQDAFLGDLVLTPGATVEGIVLDADTQQPIVGASLQLEGLGGTRWNLVRRMGGAPGAAGDVTATSDAEGRFTLRSVPPGEFSITAVHRDYPHRAGHSVRISVSESSSGSDVEANIRMEVGGAVTGRVLDAAGTGVPGAFVMVVDPNRRGRAAALSAAVETTEDGSFFVGNLEEGRVTVRRSDRIDPGVSVTIKKGETVEAILREKGTRVFGTVFSGSKPAPARVSLIASGWRAPSGDWSETYGLDGVPPGEWTLDVQVREQAPDGTFETRREREPIVVVEGLEELRHDILLEAPDHSDDVVVNGEVRDADTDEGLDGWVVSARQQGRAPVTARTDDGRFQVTLPEPGLYRVSAWPTSGTQGTYGPAESVTIEVLDGQLVSEPPLLLAKRQPEVEVEVVDVAGRKVAGALCALLDKRKNMTRDGLRVVRGVQQTDPLGRAKVAADEIGPHDLLVVVAGSVMEIRPNVDVGNEGFVTVQLPRSGSIEVVGTTQADLLGLPNGWWLRVGPGRTQFGLGEVVGDRVVMHGLPEGTYEVRVEDRTRRVEVVPGDLVSVELGR